MLDQQSIIDQTYIQHSLELARHAESQNEVPVGAVLVANYEIISTGWNCPISSNDPTAHAEIIALRQAASQLKNYRLIDTTLYVTLEPCIMCIGAILHARVKRLVFGAYDPKAGAVSSVFSFLHNSNLNHHVEVTGGVCADECGEILRAFFQKRR